MKLIKSGTILRSKLIHHPNYAKLSLPIPEKEETLIYNDIEKNGQKEPVRIDQDFNLLDGYLRDRIFGKLRLGEINYEQFHFEDEAEKLSFIISLNRMRRHYTEYQKCQMAEPLYEEEKKLAEQRQKSGTSQPQDRKGEAVKIAARAAGTSGSTFKRYLDIKKSPELPKYEKDLITGNKKVKTVHTLVTRKERNLPKAKMPKGEFDVILADVPYEHKDQGVRFSASAQFETMPAEEIAKIKVPAAENAICYFFMSPSIMYDAVPKEYKVGKTSLMINVPLYKYILDAWGFTIIKAENVWDKEIIGGGSYNRNQHENCLIAIKGKMPVPAELFSSVIKERRKPKSHSKKPESIYEIIEKNYPKRKYLELFARKKHSDKWQVFGNQIEETISLQDKCKCGHTRILHNGDDHERSCIYNCGCENFVARKRRKQNA